MAADRYRVLGETVTIGTDDPDLRALAREALCHGTLPCDGTPPCEAASAEQVDHEILINLLRSSATEERPDDRPRFRITGECLRFRSRDSRGWADRTCGQALAYLSATQIADRAWVQSEVVEHFAVYLASRRLPATLHAAGVVDGERTVLLTGPDGAGKSTLAYACVRAGLRLLAEDVVFAGAPDDPDLYHGRPGSLHLMPDAVALFPELAASERIRRADGEEKLRIRLSSLPMGGTCPSAGGTCPSARIDATLVLERSGRRETVVCAVEPHRMRRALTVFKGNPPTDRSAMDAAVDRLFRGRTGLLRIGTDMDRAVLALRRWLADA